MATRLLAYDDVAGTCELAGLVPYPDLASAAASITVTETIAADGSKDWNIEAKQIRYVPGDTLPATMVGNVIVDDGTGTNTTTTLAAGGTIPAASNIEAVIIDPLDNEATCVSKATSSAGVFTANGDGTITIRMGGTTVDETISLHALMTEITDNGNFVGG